MSNKRGRPSSDNKRTYGYRLRLNKKEWDIVQSLISRGLVVSDIFREALKKYDEDYEPVHPKSGGPYSLYCERCHCWVPNTANYEMRREGYYSHSHICGIKGPGEIYENEGE